MKPELPQDRKLTAVSREARYTFVLLWTIADDDGLFRAEPRQLLGDLYPYDADVTEERLEGWLAELSTLGVLRWRMTRDSARVGEIVNWAKHQVIRNRSKSFLLNELRPADVDPTQTLRRPYVDSTQSLRTPYVDPANLSVAESGVLSLESRVLSQESNTTSPQNGERKESTPWEHYAANDWKGRIKPDKAREWFAMAGFPGAAIPTDGYANVRGFLKSLERRQREAKTP